MRRLLTILLCGWLTIICAWAGDTIASQLSYCRLTTLDGLPQMQAETVFQDSEGYVWIGTLSGFVRYDGRTLTPFLKGRRENIVAITETAEGVSGLGFRRQWLVDGDKVTMRFIDPDQQWLTNNADADQHWLLNNFNSTDLPIGIILLEDEQETHRTLARLTEDGWTPLLKAGVFDLMMPDRKMYIDDDDIYVPTEKGLYLVRQEYSGSTGRSSSRSAAPGLPDGTVALHFAARHDVTAPGELFSSNPPEYAETQVTAIPYALWQNRGAGDMQVFMLYDC